MYFETKDGGVNMDDEEGEGDDGEERRKKWPNLYHWIRKPAVATCQSRLQSHLATLICIIFLRSAPSLPPTKMLQFMMRVGHSSNPQIC